MTDFDAVTTCENCGEEIARIVHSQAGPLKAYCWVHIDTFERTGQASTARYCNLPDDPRNRYGLFPRALPFEDIIQGIEEQ